MKAATPLPVLALFASVAAAATSISDCAQMCLNNMLALAPSLGCASEDIACLCANKDFGYGIHDCTVEACQNDNVDEVVAYARTLCNQQTGNGAGNGQSSASGLGSQSSNGATQTDTKSGDNAGSGTGATTSAIVTTIISGSSTIVSTIGSTTVPAGGILPSGSSTAAPTTSEPASESTRTSTRTSTSSDSDADSGDETGAGAGAGSATGATSSAANSEAPADSTDAAMPIATIGSGAAGIVGLAALLIL
ncbi:hypothetical protein VTN31DRAFT_2881 [Thermomyces dupontii]|uniref:uncharacterized protein n=1 Tax=Talaromyces thermophilus TaxID=28565 RepID=UPI003743A34C